MKYLLAVALSAVGTVSLATTGFAQYPTPGFSVLQAEQAAGRKVFNDHCAPCHTKPVSYGPSLNGVLGRRAGVLSFPYSDALKSSGLIWTEDNLRKWIADSGKMIPNALMPHVAISDPAEQIYLIAYLKTLKASAGR
jgi:cytochrome c